MKTLTSLTAALITGAVLFGNVSAAEAKAQTNCHKKSKEDTTQVVSPDQNADIHSVDSSDNDMAKKRVKKRIKPVAKASFEAKRKKGKGRSKKVVSSLSSRKRSAHSRQRIA